MIITWKGRKFEFRECDTEGSTQETVEQMAEENGDIQYEPVSSWLFVPGIGFGWEV